MKRYFLVILTFFSLLNAGESIAQVAIAEGVVKEPIPGQAVSAGYFTIQNSGDTTKKLVTVSSVHADRIEMHTHTHEGGMMSMKKLDFVNVDPGAELEFLPGGHHLMIFSLDEAALESGSIELNFEFEDGESQTIQASIERW